MPGDADPQRGIQLNTWGPRILGSGDRTPVIPSQQGFGKFGKLGAG